MKQIFKLQPSMFGQRLDACGFVAASNEDSSIFECFQATEEIQNLFLDNESKIFAKCSIKDNQLVVHGKVRNQEW